MLPPRSVIIEQLKELMGGLISAFLYFFLGLTPLHCAVLAHNAVVHELQRNQQPHSPEVQELLLKNKSLVDTIKCLIQMGAAVEAKVNSQKREQTIVPFPTVTFFMFLLPRILILGCDGSLRGLCTSI